VPVSRQAGSEVAVANTSGATPEYYVIIAGRKRKRAPVAG